MMARVPSRLAPIAAALGTLFSLSAHAIGPPLITRTVTTCADNPDETGTLRNALDGLNDADNLIVDFSVTCSKITLLDGALVSSAGSVTLNGPADPVLTIDGNHADRVFVHYGSRTLTVNNLTIANGLYTRGPHGGGGIYAVGNVYLDHATVTGNHVYSHATTGGGVYSLGSVTLKLSSVSGNSASYGIAPLGQSGKAGGVYAKAGFYAYSSTIVHNIAAISGGGVVTAGSSVIVGSTFSGNEATNGAALLSTGQHLRITNSTLSGNESESSMYTSTCATVNSQLTYLYNSTIARNTCHGAGAVLLSGGTNMVSSIVAANTLQGGAYDVMGVATIAGNNNIVGTARGTLPAGTVRSDPQLLPLADNGGPTLTMALAPTSPAIDAGDNPLGLTTDQRGTGFARVSGLAPDIGAFESQDPIFANGFE